MTKRYLKTPEEVIDALQDGKVVIDGEGYNYKLYKGIIFWKYKEKWAVTPTTSCLYGLYVDEPKPLKLEVGKFYKTRDGRKAFVYTNTGNAAYPCWVVLVNSSEGGTYCCTVDGQYTTNEEHNKDLVDPWEE